MAMFDDPGKALRQLDKELKAAQPREEAPLGEEDFFFPGDVPSEGAAYYEEDYRRDRKTRHRKKREARKAGGFGLLALLDLLAIASVIGWWILWISGRL